MPPVLTRGHLLVEKFEMQVEHLLLSFTLQQLQLLSPAHHVAQIPHLRTGTNGSRREDHQTAESELHVKSYYLAGNNINHV